MSSASKFSGNLVQVVEPQMSELDVIRQIVNDGQEDCFYLCNVSDIVRKYKNWKQAMPRIKTFYAVKCNDSRIVLETLVALGVGFDCASKEEIEKILSMGVHPDRIIFAHPCKKPSHIRYAAEVGVSLMTFDNEEELYKIKRDFPEANLVLRIRYDDPTSIYVLGKKFGIDAEEGAKNLLKLAHSLNLNVVGVSFHIGSGSKNYRIYSQAIATAKEVFEIGTRIGYKFTLLDIGGGFPGDKDCDISKIGDYINKAVAQHFPDISVQIIAEPGKYYVDSAFTLATTITTRKSLVKEDENGNNIETKMYYVDAGIYNALLSSYFGDTYYPQPLYDQLKSPVYPSLIWGPTCDCSDKICENVDLPLMHIGDWIVFENTGAYSMSLSCPFNGYPTPNVHTIISTEDWLLLTEKVTFPIPKTRYTRGMSRLHFKTGLDIHDFDQNKYHLL